MAYQVFVTDFNGAVRAIVHEYKSMQLTRRLGDFSEFKLELDPREQAATEILIAERALKVYDGNHLRYFGQVWEPLEITSSRFTVNSRDPFAGMAWRRVRAAVTYTAQDAGAIAYARLAVQNGYRDTFMAGQSAIVRAGTLTDESPVVTGLSSTSDLRAGMAVSGLGLWNGPKVLSVDSSSQITLDKPVNTSGSKSGTGANGSPTITGISDTSDIMVGQKITGTAGFAGTPTILSKTSSSITVDVNSSATGAITVLISQPASQSLTFSENASTNRTITYDPGKREDEIVRELSAMAGGFFFRIDPLDGVAGKMGTLRVLYPDAGTTRAEVRFGYGENTVDNLADFRLVRMLPITRFTAASQDADGGRIAAAAENAPAIAQFGLFEDEVAFTDLENTTLLQPTADAGTKPTPPLTIELTPNVNAPLLFDDFDVGDFVKLNIGYGPLEVQEWVRVIEAVVAIDKKGIATLDSVTVETLTGSRINQDPARLFRAQLDANRTRLEALERRVQEITTTPAAAPGAPPPSGGSDGSSDTPVDTPPPPPPPPAPTRVPGVAMSQAFGFWDDRGRGGHLAGAVTPFDSLTNVFFIVRSGSAGGPVVKITPERLFSASNNLSAVIEDTTGLSAGVYFVALNAANSAGQATSGYISFTVPAVKAS